MFSQNWSFLRVLSTSWYFAWGDLRTRYKRSALGPAWLVLGTSIGVAGLGYVWATLLNMPKEEFVPLLTVGLVVWQFISSCINESSNVFYRNSVVIRNVKLPLLLFSMQLLFKHFFYFLHNLIVIVFVYMFFDLGFKWEYLLSILGFFIVSVNMLWIITVVGMIGARYRDLEAFIASIMPLLFFLSPVLYKPATLGLKAKLLWFNPFTYMISLIRDPLQGFVPSIEVYIVSLISIVFGFCLLLFLLRKYSKRLAFWM